jgi:hypothetical protein
MDAQSQASFGAIITQADAQFEGGNFAAAKALYQSAADAEPTHPNAFYAVVRIEACDALISAKSWFGDRPPAYQPVAVFCSMPIAASETPDIRRVLCGQSAYDAFHADTYLTELLRIRRHPNVLHAAFLLLYLAARSQKASRIEFTEIGASLYAAYEKLHNAEAHAIKCGAVGEPIAVHHICVELSERLRLLASALHHGLPVSYYPAWSDVPTAEAPRFAFSIGVANYAFAGTDEFMIWVRQSRALVVRERFTLTGDFTHHIMGKRFVCFDLAALAAALDRHGYRMNVLSITEAPRFLDRADQSAPGAIFFNACVFIHRLTDDELKSIAAGLAVCGAEEIQPFYDTDTPVKLTAEAILDPMPWRDLVASKEWRGDYLAPRRSGGSRYDFAPTSVRTHLANHLAMLDRVYDGGLADTLAESDRGRGVKE